MAQYFIKHPLRAVVVAIFLTALGLIAAFSLPVEEYPNMNQPTVTVSTDYTGADANVLQDTVAKIIEDEIRGIDGIESLSSISDSSGSYQLTVTFDYGIDGDIAAVNIQNRLSSIMSSLPQEVQKNGVQVSRNTKDMIFAMALYSPNGTYDSVYLQNYAKAHFLDRIKRVSGVGSVEEYTDNYSMRIWLRPDKLAAYGLAINDVTDAINEQNVRPAVGSLGKMPVVSSEEKQIIGRVTNRKETSEDFENIILKSDNAGFIRLKDVANIKEGAKDTRYMSLFDGKESAAAYSVTLSDNANALTTIHKIKEILKEAEEIFPPDMECRIAVDRTQYIGEAMGEVSHTFLIALILVALVMFFFLNDAKATFIAVLTVPVSLFATFIAFNFLGFTINLLTLFAMILSIGLVVDDAIVVIESVERERERGKNTIEATQAAMKNVEKPIVAIAAILAAVFLPVAFFEGITGILYKQFALTIAVSMGISAFVALSFTPALCVLLFSSTNYLQNNGWSKSFQKIISGIEQKYINFLNKCLIYARFAVLFLFMIVGLTVLLYKYLPTEFIPGEDQGYFMLGLNLPEGASMNRTLESVKRVSNALRDYEAIEGNLAIVGADLLLDTTKSDSAIFFVALKDWSERNDMGINAEDISDWVTERLKKVAPEARSLIIAPFISKEISLHILDITQHKDEELNILTANLRQALAAREELNEFEVNFNINAPYMNFTVNEERAKELNVNITDIYSAMRICFGGEEVNDFVRFAQVYKTVLQADAAYRREAADLRYIFVRNSDGKMIPLSALVTAKLSEGPTFITRYDGARSIQVNVTAADGFSSGEAMNAVRETITPLLTSQYRLVWSNDSLQEKRAQDEVLKILALSFAFVFLCLAALYENWSLPLAVILSTPPGILGALISMNALDLPVSIFVQIGILLIVGLTAKNAILIIEFAKNETEKGESPLNATLTAASLRFRPIIMTSIAFIIGCIPLALTEGAGSMARNSMGIAVVGGMSLATIIGIFLTPALYLLIANKK